MWTGSAVPSGAEVQAEAIAGTLQQVTVTTTGARVVVTLIGDQALDGVLEVVADPPARIFVDLANVRPDVDRVTDVNGGAVTRVRVALNQAQPPVTRVVLDLHGPLDGSTTYVLERGATDHELRIIVDTPAAPPADATSAYASWFTSTSHTVARLLTKESRDIPSDVDAVDHFTWLTLEWDAVLTEVHDATPPPTFEVAHRLLTTASMLGRVNAAARADGSVPSTHASAATVGAQLLLKRAQDSVNLQGAGALSTP